jgi:subtilisin family serine protease
MPVIHGANLSLGGTAPVGSYGCGFSPECQEANRLMNSGVVVCIAASNDGYKTLATIGSGNKLEYFPTFMDMGISDPGNAEDVITVGSTHKKSPHTYGISWFSSKGPTGDGRFKPDVVAPGERISSAGITSNKSYTAMSGTSMATPHVSGAVAQFLSVKPEFIGQARKVKEILMSSCTDLGRDRCFQGAGLVDILRMIQSV